MVIITVTVQEPEPFSSAVWCAVQLLLLARCCCHCDKGLMLMFCCCHWCFSVSAAGVLAGHGVP